MRQDEKRNVANSQKKASVRTFEKKVRKAVSDKNFDEAEKAYQKYTSLIDRAAKTNIYHKNTAGRKKSRLAKLIAKEKAAV